MNKNGQKYYDWPVEKLFEAIKKFYLESKLGIDDQTFQDNALLFVRLICNAENGKEAAS